MLIKAFMFRIAILIISLLITVPILIKFCLPYLPISYNITFSLSEYYGLLVQIFLVILTFFLTIITALPFFNHEREKHYSKLNTQFFLPIQQLSLQNNDVFLKYEMPTLPDSLIIFDIGLIHFRKHNPNFDLEGKIKGLRKTIEDFNNESNRLNDLFQKNIIQSFSPYRTIYNKSEIEKKLNLNVLENYIKPFIRKLDPKLSSRDILSIIHNQIDSLNFNKKNSSILITNTYICQNCEYSIEEIKDKLKNIVNYEIIELIKKLTSYNDNIISVSNELKKSVKNIPQSISNGDYDTILKCCPGIMTYINQYVRIRK